MNKRPIRLSWARVDQWLDDDYFKPLEIGKSLFATPGGIIYHRVDSEYQSAVFFPAKIAEHKGRAFLTIKGDEGTEKEVPVDAVIFEAFYCEIPHGWRVSHADGDIGNDALNNLRLVSRFNNEKWEEETPVVYKKLRGKVGLLRARKVMAISWFALAKILLWP